MGNCKKQNRKHSELNVNEILGRIKFESKQIQEAYEDIGKILRQTEQLMRQLPIRGDNQVLNTDTFFNVTEAPVSPPVAAPPTPPPAASLPPLGDLRRVLLLNINRELRRLVRLQATVRELFRGIVSFLAGLPEGIEGGIFNPVVSNLLIFTIDRITSIRREIQEIRDEIIRLGQLLAQSS